MLAIIPAQIVVFAVLPMPSSGLEWIEMFNLHPVGSLLHLDLLYVINNALICVMYLGIFVLLVKDAGGLALLGLVLGLVGVAAYFPTVRAFELQDIARLYFASDDSVLKSGLVAVADGMIAEWQGTGFAVYYIFNAFALLFFAIAMFRSNRFKRPISVFALAAALLMMVPSTFGDVGLVFSLLSLIPWIVFAALLAVKLRKHSKGRESVVQIR